MKQGWRRGLTEWRIGGGRAELTWHGTHDAAQLSRRIVTRVGVLNLRRRLLRTEEGFGVHDEGWIEVRSVSEICCELVAEFRSRGRATSTSIGGVTASIAHASCLPFPPSSLSSPRTPTSNRKDARWNAGTLGSLPDPAHRRPRRYRDPQLPRSARWPRQRRSPERDVSSYTNLKR